MDREKMRIAGVFRTNVLMRTGFSSFRTNYNQSSACFRLGYLLARRLSDLLSSAVQALQTLPHASVSPSPPKHRPTALTHITEYKRHTEDLRPVGEGRQRSNIKVRTELITKLVTGRELWGKLANYWVRRAMERIKTAGRLAETFGRDLGSSVDLPRSGETAAGKSLLATDVLRRSEHLSQRVSSILRLIESRKTPSISDRGDMPSSRSSARSRESTPKRNLNLRIPTGGSISNSPLTPISMGDLESDTARVYPSQPTDRSSPSSQHSHTISDELSRLDAFEQKLCIWKTWKGYIMRKRLTRLKMSIGDRNSALKLQKKCVNSLRKWVEIRRYKQEKYAVADAFHYRLLAKSVFLRFVGNLLGEIRSGQVCKLHPSRIVAKSFGFWRKWSKNQRIHREKCRFLTNSRQRKTKFRLISMWKIVIEMQKRMQKQSENALFFWYSKIMPKYWEKLTKGVECVRKKREKIELSYEIHRKLLLSRIIPHWKSFCDYKYRIREKSAILEQTIIENKAKFALKTLFANAINKKKWLTKLNFAYSMSVQRGKSHGFRRFIRGIKELRSNKAKHYTAFDNYSSRLLIKIIDNWAKFTAKRRNLAESANVISENITFATLKNGFFLWRTAFERFASIRDEIDSKREFSLRKIAFSEMKSAISRKIQKRKRYFDRISTAKLAHFSKIFRFWRSEMQKIRLYRKDSELAALHFVRIHFKAWRVRFLRVNSLKKVILRGNLKLTVNKWKQISSYLRIKSYELKIAEKHWKENRIKRAFSALFDRNAVKKKGKMLIATATRKKAAKKLHIVLNAWKKVRLLVRRDTYAQKLSSDFAATRFHQFVSDLFTSLRLYVRKTAQIRKKSLRFRIFSALNRFEFAIFHEKQRKSSLRKMQKSAICHLRTVRLEKGIKRLYRRISVKNHLESKEMLSVRLKITAGLDRWKKHHFRYLSLMRKAANHYEKKAQITKKAALKHLSTHGKSKKWGKRMEKRIFFYWDRRVQRLFLAWKGIVHYRKEMSEEITKIQLIVILKSYFVTLLSYSQRKKAISHFRTTSNSRKRTETLQNCFHAMQSDAYFRSKLRTSQLSTLRNRAVRLSKQIFSNWSEYAQTYHRKKRVLSGKMHIWRLRKEMQFAQSYVQPRLRRNTGAKLSALCKWKLATEKNPIPAPAIHVFMKFLAPKDSISMESSANSGKDSKAVLEGLWGMWRAAVVFNRVFTDFKVTILRKKLLGRTSFAAMRRGMMLMKVRRKKMWNAVLFARLKKKAEVVAAWRGVAVVARKPRSGSVSSRTKSAPLRTKSAIKAH